MHLDVQEGTEMGLVDSLQAVQSCETRRVRFALCEGSWNLKEIGSLVAGEYNKLPSDRELRARYMVLLWRDTAISFIRYSVPSSRSLPILATHRYMLEDSQATRSFIT